MNKMEAKQKAENENLQQLIEILTVSQSQMTETLQQIQQQMTEERKENEHGLQQQIDELTVSVHKLLSKNGTADDSEKAAFKNWVLNVLKLNIWMSSKRVAWRIS